MEEEIERVRVGVGAATTAASSSSSSSSSREGKNKAKASRSLLPPCPPTKPPRRALLCSRARYNSSRASGRGCSTLSSRKESSRAVLSGAFAGIRGEQRRGRASDARDDARGARPALFALALRPPRSSQREGFPAFRDLPLPWRPASGSRPAGASACAGRIWNERKKNERKRREKTSEIRDLEVFFFFFFF